MTAEVKEHIGEIRGVKVRWVDVIVAGHTVEQVLSFDVAEAEAAHGRPFDDESDEHIQMGMFAVDRIAADGTMHKVASARSYVLDGMCIRTAKIEHCREIEPMSAGWRITRAGGRGVGCCEAFRGNAMSFLYRVAICIPISSSLSSPVPAIALGFEHL